MGVPNFLSWIESRYPLVVRYLTDPTVPQADCLFIDFNSIIHTCLEKSFIPDDSEQMDTVTSVLLFLDSFIQLIQPTSLLYIAVDGVSSIAKFNTQRERRRANGASTAGQFSSAAFTVGTAFSAALSSKLLDFVQKRVTSNTAWSRPSVILDNGQNPGEGEHKIFKYLHDNKQTYPKDAVTFIYTPDSDLFLFGILSEIPNLFIISNRRLPSHKPTHSEKKNGISPSLFSVYSIDIFKDYIAIDMTGSKPPSTDVYVKDFCIISFLFGSDFLPKVSGLNLQYHMDDSISIYRNKIYPTGQPLFNCPNFVPETFSLLLSSLKSYIRIQKQEPCISAGSSMIKGLHWIYDLYSKGSTSFQWVYDAPQPPTTDDIEMALRNELPSFQTSLPVPPLVALMLLLPEGNESYAPSCLRPFIIECGNSPHIDINHWLPIALEFFNQHKAELTSEELERNATASPLQISAKEMSVKPHSMIPTLFSVSIRASKFSPSLELINESQPPSETGNFTLAGWPYLTPAAVTSSFQGKGKQVLGVENATDYLNVRVKFFPQKYIESNLIAEFPIQLTFPMSKLEPIDFAPRSEASKLETGSQVIVRNGTNKGGLATINSMSSEGLSITGAKFFFSHQYSFKSGDDWVSISRMAKAFHITDELLTLISGTYVEPIYQKQIGMKLFSDKKGVPGWCTFFSGEVQLAKETRDIYDGYLQRMGPIKDIFIKSSSPIELKANIKAFSAENPDVYSGILSSLDSWISERSPGIKYKKLNMRFRFPHFSFFGRFENSCQYLKKAEFSELVEGKDIIYPGNPNVNSDTKLFAKPVVYTRFDGVVPVGTFGYVFGILGGEAYVASAQEIEFGSTFFGNFQKKRVFLSAMSDLLPILG